MLVCGGECVQRREHCQHGRRVPRWTVLCGRQRAHLFVRRSWSLVSGWFVFCVGCCLLGGVIRHRRWRKHLHDSKLRWRVQRGAGLLLRPREHKRDGRRVRDRVLLQRWRRGARDLLSRRVLVWRCGARCKRDVVRCWLLRNDGCEWVHEQQLRGCLRVRAGVLLWRGLNIIRGFCVSHWPILRRRHDAATDVQRGWLLLPPIFRDPDLIAVRTRVLWRRRQRVQVLDFVLRGHVRG